MENVKYSVLMSVYYKENPVFLRESVQSILNQTIKPFEIIIVKDGELTKELDNVILEFEENSLIKIISLKENKGLGEALNVGLNYCSSELVARMDTDDISMKDRCEKQLRLFDQNKSLSIISSAVAEFEEDVNSIHSIKKIPITHEEIIRFSKKRNPFNHPAVMYKKSAVLRAGGYKHFSLYEDYYLWVRMIMDGAVCANIDEPLVYMRANENMYKRRGGFNYFKNTLNFKWHLVKLGFYTKFDFVMSALPHAIVSLLPNKARIIVYNKFLRS
ncbi:glycosyltransferase [Bacillus sp. CGMCC 1.16541]|uniref:glycosyltransferase n=1 Tax=Bacillus sp. CGMCC 1.16541 TaxID=2185143 RepID=UPI000D73E6C9|nr:glycosyltransferase [Bacillus sp. CGMCC 1.16541]